MNNFKHSTDFAKNFIPCFYHYFVNEPLKLLYFYHPEAYVYRYSQTDPNSRFPRQMSKCSVDPSSNFEQGSTIYINSFTVVPLEFDVLLTVNGIVKTPTGAKVLFSHNFAFQEYDGHIFIVSDCLHSFQQVSEIHEGNFFASSYKTEIQSETPIVPPVVQMGNATPHQIQKPIIKTNEPRPLSVVLSNNAKPLDIIKPQSNEKSLEIILPHSAPENAKPQPAPVASQPVKQPEPQAPPKHVEQSPKNIKEQTQASSLHAQPQSDAQHHPQNQQANKSTESSYKSRKDQKPNNNRNQDQKQEKWSKQNQAQKHDNNTSNNQPQSTPPTPPPANQPTSPQQSTPNSSPNKSRNKKSPKPNSKFVYIPSESK